MNKMESKKTSKIFIGLMVILVVVNGIFLISYFKEDKNVNDKIEFSYNVSVSTWDFTFEEYTKKNGTEPLESPENFNEIEINGNKVKINQVFGKSSPCTSMNYTIVKENNTIIIIPKLIPNEGMCTAVIAYDDVEIDLTLNSGAYKINIYNFYNQETPFLTKEITII